MVMSRWLWKAGPERAGSTERIGRLWYRSTGCFSTTYTILLTDGKHGVYGDSHRHGRVVRKLVTVGIFYVLLYGEKNPRFRESGDSDDEDEDDRKRRR
ncbi:hypothetical protein B296_00014264 [Ensete ventricosum]|uniref:Uncharacterized protein n=1 Tax=Ensete ventricosum TaxID=4639 RepID=A0A427AT46_ENSVE|nr:hypothetical protein B296_00014264 [Ensete ventricosum]